MPDGDALWREGSRKREGSTEMVGRGHRITEVTQCSHTEGNIHPREDMLHASME